MHSVRTNVPISRRSARRSVRILGVASASAALALGVSSSAFACNIKEFSAEATCDGSNGVITVTDKDASGTPATISVFLENNGADARQVGDAKPIKGTKDGATVSFSEDWAPNAVYRIRVTTDNGKVDADIKDNLTTPSTACKSAESSSPSPSDSATPSPSATETTPAESDSPTPSATDSTTAPASTSDNAPSPAVGESNLAETGANSNTGLIAGIAAALVVVGGGAVWFGMRRRGAHSGN
ncbi:LAETG motif-containing sortase-dependent surface protein [Streptomyces sp. NPDC001714]|uniref:LAETG motif-containing sortase-dependent surface protein n=1 Tax=Streptomyces sp. NPDC001714 TaxID=3364603 RepID=UPI00368C14E5